VPLFSVIIPTYNRRLLLARALESVRGQVFRDFETIVVDDGSTDGTAEYLATLCATITTIRQQNGGPSAARNAGARVARGEYLAFLDSDDELLPSALASCARVIRDAAHPSLVSGCLAEIRDGDTRPAEEGQSFACRRFETYFSAAAMGIYVGACQLRIRRDVLLAAGGFDEAMRVGEDHDLLLRVGGAPGFVEIVSPPSVVRHLHAGSISSDGRHLYRGLATLVQRGHNGFYGRCEASRRAARSIVGAHARAASVTLARGHHLAYACMLYLRSLGINSRQSRWRYVAGFPLFLAWRSLTTGWRGRPASPCPGAR
jgi:glycosyltransferase involved in cell wall biosynthesis